MIQAYDLQCLEEIFLNLRHVCLARAFLQIDLVQEIVSRLHGDKLLNRLDQVDAPAHYLVTTIRRMLLDQDRKEKRSDRAQELYLERKPESEDLRDPSNRAADREMQKHIRFAVNHLVDAKDRAILGRFYFESASLAGIAIELEISEGAAAQRLSRARLSLKRRLLDYLDQPE
ncbi:MAG: sigma-70 family RNA polymerase sigma factor [Gemmataceae bacterium]|nr:sigma-70 family RNA polymerase sigma factor [Gemmataceae bacterium]